MRHSPSAQPQYYKKPSRGQSPSYKNTYVVKESIENRLDKEEIALLESYALTLLKTVRKVYVVPSVKSPSFKDYQNQLFTLLAKMKLKEIKRENVFEEMKRF